MAFWLPRRDSARLAIDTGASSNEQTPQSRAESTLAGRQTRGQLNAWSRSAIKSSMPSRPPRPIVAQRDLAVVQPAAARPAGRPGRLPRSAAGSRRVRTSPNCPTPFPKPHSIPVIRVMVIGNNRRSLDGWGALARGHIRQFHQDEAAGNMPTEHRYNPQPTCETPLRRSRIPT